MQLIKMKIVRTNYESAKKKHFPVPSAVCFFDEVDVISCCSIITKRLWSILPSANTETIKHLDFLLDIVDPYNECDEEGKPS